eukprot:2504588-Amphidinium_carterae.1
MECQDRASIDKEVPQSEECGCTDHLTIGGPLLTPRVGCGKLMLTCEPIVKADKDPGVLKVVRPIAHVHLHECAVSVLQTSPFSNQGG